MDRFIRILALVMALLLTSVIALAEESATVVQDGVEYRVEKDSMGEMLVPTGPLLGCADPAQPRKLPDRRGY